MATNGLLGGLVAITASSAMVDTEGAFVIGVGSGVLVFYGSGWLLKLKIDDVVDASVVHGLCGLWGVFSAALFTTKDGYARAISEVCFRPFSCVGCCKYGGFMLLFVDLRTGL